MVAFLKDFLRDKQTPVSYASIRDRNEEDRLLLAMIAKRQAVEASEEREAQQRIRELRIEEEERKKTKLPLSSSSSSSSTSSSSTSSSSTSSSSLNILSSSSSSSNSLAPPRSHVPSSFTPVVDDRDDDCVPDAPDAKEGEDDWMNML